MQQNYFELLETLNQSSAELLKTISESNQTAFNTLLSGQWDMASLGKLAQTTLTTTQAIANHNTSLINSLLSNSKNPKELEVVASSIEELISMVGSMATAMTEMRVNAFNQCATGYVTSLRAMKSATTPEEILAVQAQHYTQLQDKMKASADAALLTLTSLQSGLKAWVESSVGRMAESGNSPE